MVSEGLAKEESEFHIGQTIAEAMNKDLPSRLRD
jgi:hypothetical protein